MVIAGDHSLLERGDHVLVIRCWHREIIIYCVTKSPITISFKVFTIFLVLLENLESGLRLKLRLHDQSCLLLDSCFRDRDSYNNHIVILLFILRVPGTNFHASYFVCGNINRAKTHLQRRITDIFSRWGMGNAQGADLNKFNDNRD